MATKKKDPIWRDDSRLQNLPGPRGPVGPRQVISNQGRTRPLEPRATDLKQKAANYWLLWVMFSFCIFPSWRGFQGQTDWQSGRGGRQNWATQTAELDELARMWEINTTRAAHCIHWLSLSEGTRLLPSPLRTKRAPEWLSKRLELRRQCWINK